MKREAAVILWAILVATVGCGGGGGGGGGSDDGGEAPPSSPAAPTGVSVTAGPQAVSVSWSAVASAKKYNVYFASQSGITKSNYASKPDGAKHADVTSPHICTNLTNGKTYSFVVTAQSDGGESDESIEVSATPVASLTQLPGQPTAPANSNLPSVTPPALSAADYSVGQNLSVSFRNLLLVFKDTTTVGDANSLLSSIHAQVIGTIPAAFALFLRVPLSNLQEMMSLLSTLNDDARVQTAVMDIATAGEILPPANTTLGLWMWDDVPDYSAAPPPRPAAFGNWGLKVIRAPQVWNLDTYVRRHKAANVVAAGALDAGFTDGLAAAGSSSHEDFTRADGSVILQISPSPVPPPGLPGPVPVNDHGTMVTGIIGASWDNGLGVEGVNPWLQDIQARPRHEIVGQNSWSVALSDLIDLLRVHPTVVAVNNSYGMSGTYLDYDRCDDGVVNGSFNPAAIEFGAFNNNGNHTDACPLGNEFPGVDMNGDGHLETWAQVVQHFGDIYFQAFTNFAAANRSNFFLVSSAGNGGEGGQTALHNSPLNYAAGTRLGRFLSVESINNLQALSTFSDRGGIVSAPGECIRAPEALNGVGANNYDDLGCPWCDGANGVAVNPAYSTDSGTSLAAPYVTGVIAALWKLDEHLTVDQMRTLLTAEAYAAPTTGGAHRRIDAFAAAMGIDVVLADGNKTLQRALVDVDDGTVDGNKRTVRGDDNRIISNYSTVDTADSRRGDGRISMADFRALRDAATQALLEDGQLTADSVSLDGWETHFKKDLNFDGCIGTSPVDPPHPAVTMRTHGSCASAPAENTYPRYDFNGDGRVGTGRVGGTTGFVAFKGHEWTDLEVLQDVWPTGDVALTEGWDTGGLQLLFPTPAGGGAGDVEFRSALALGGTNPYDEIRITISQNGTPVTRSIQAPPAPLLWTLPVGAQIPVTVEGFKGGKKVGTLCTNDGSVVSALKHGEDRVVMVDECGLAQFSDRWNLDARSVWTEPQGTLHPTIYEAVDRTPVDYPCSNLKIGQSCTREFTDSSLYSSHSGTLTIRRIADLEWAVTGRLRVVPSLPPMPVPTGTFVCGQNNVLCGTQSFRDLELGAGFLVGRPGNYRVNVTCSASGDAKWSYLPAVTLPTSYTSMDLEVGNGTTLMTMPNCRSPDTTALKAPGWVMSGSYQSQPLSGDQLMLWLNVDGYGKAYEGPNSGGVPFADTVEVRDISVWFRADPSP